MRRALLTLSGLALLAGAAFPVPRKDDYAFAKRLQEGNLPLLASEVFGRLLAKGEGVPEKERDKANLALFRLCNDLANRAKTPEEQARLKKEGETALARIQNKTDRSMQVELMKASLQALKGTDFQMLSAKDDEKPKLQAVARKTFGDMIPVVDKIRGEVKAWMDEYDKKEEPEQKKLASEKADMSELSMHVNLLFGETVVVFANIVGKDDAEVKKWLLTMTEEYENFIQEHFDSPAAMLGNLYLGEANILLGNYTTKWKEKRDGFKMGVSQFDEAIAGLQGMGAAHAKWRDQTLLNAYTKMARALELVGQFEEAVKAIDKFLSWRDPAKISYAKDKNTHDICMRMLQQKCLLLEKTIAAKRGDRDKLIQQLLDAANRGKALCEQAKSPFAANFRVILKRIDINDIKDVNADIAWMKAEDLFRKALAVPEAEAAKAKPLFVEASVWYKKTMGLAFKEGKAKTNELAPGCLHKMGTCLVKLDNLPLAAACFLQAIEMFPAEAFPEKDAPEIYKVTGKCADLAKYCAQDMYRKWKGSFEESLYDRILTIISRCYPEKGGDPDFFRGELKKSGAKYKEAIAFFEKVQPKSNRYLLSQYNIADCGYEEMRDREEEVKKADPKKPDPKTPEYQQPRTELLARFQKVLDLCQQKLERPKEMTDDQFAILEKNRQVARDVSLSRMGTIHKELGQDDKARQVYEQIATINAAPGGNPERQRNAVRNLIFIDYRAKDMDKLRAGIERIEKFPEDDTWPERTKDLTTFYNMVANLFVQKLKPLQAEVDKLASTTGASQDLVAAKRNEAGEVGRMIVDCFEKTLDMGGEKEKDKDTLVNAISYSNQYATDPGRTLAFLEKYFQWFPDRPELDALYAQMVTPIKKEEAAKFAWDAALERKKPEEWDAKLGGNFAKMTIFDKDYRAFLDALFDTYDLSALEMRKIQEIQTRKEIADRPRNYARALEIFARMEKDRAKDSKFDKLAYPELVKLVPKIKDADFYFTAKYMMAQCSKKMQKHEQAAKLYAELSRYYVEYSDVRMELANAALASGTKEGIAQAKATFADLIAVMPDDQSPYYKPIEYYTVWQGYTAARLAGYKDDKDPDKELVNLWMQLAKAFYKDPHYMASVPKRWTELGITTEAAKAEHKAFLDQLRVFVETKVLPVVKTSKSNDEFKDKGWKDVVKEGT